MGRGVARSSLDDLECIGAARCARSHTAHQYERISFLEPAFICGKTIKQIPSRQHNAGCNFASEEREGELTNTKSNGFLDGFFVGGLGNAKRNKRTRNLHIERRTSMDCSGEYWAKNKQTNKKFAEPARTPTSSRTQNSRSTAEPPSHRE
jgi:hypothetical protein